MDMVSVMPDGIGKQVSVSLMVITTPETVHCLSVFLRLREREREAKREREREIKRERGGKVHRQAGRSGLLVTI